MTLLAIETSCDETAAAVLRDGQLLSSVVASQQEHLKWGGVVPELASRAHIIKIVPVVQQALNEANVDLNDIEGVAATYGPGLIGSLLVGLTFAKGLAMSRKVPFLGVNHLEGHLFSAMIEYPDLPMPFLALVVSGGHTILALVQDIGRYHILGETRDDAAGEAFDKVAKILDLPYPGGPSIEKLAREGNPEAVKFPVAKLKGNPYDFSFSGLKTAVLYYYNKLSDAEKKRQRADVAASFQKAVVRALSEKVALAVKKKNIRHVVVAGGVARNRRLADAISALAEKHDFEVYIPSLQYCTDNAAMIGKAADLFFRQGKSSPLNLPPRPNLTLTESSTD
ncbi:MAG: tRNA (adenosine(37)-N6)-threonylcarbamoyltransferase complex transferase subunit TsaD [candidate division KSB1 bacterium]|nr:tRNA (adenosine(37)-N6)-threonylcarbamoyltransferase complex transferase subunit TsaD [candidate division KSB1 bacterium]MDQ7066162.1 tRNA (adenosine(37)-N6)-threonylcarbamoyltransferase complex transferase subunit TsaD [candidate division KSB1 bacterium]